MSRLTSPSGPCIDCVETRDWHQLSGLKQVTKLQCDLQAWVFVERSQVGLIVSFIPALHRQLASSMNSTMWSLSELCEHGVYRWIQMARQRALWQLRLDHCKTHRCGSLECPSSVSGRASDGIAPGRVQAPGGDIGIQTRAVGCDGTSVG